MTDKTYQFAVELTILINAKDQAEALRALLDAIEKDCGIATKWGGFVTETNTTRVKR